MEGGFSMSENKRMRKVLNLLDENYPKDIKCYLDHENPWQLLIATILSAQCTDDRVNIVTKDLFRKYTSVKDFAEVSNEELEQDIRSTGFYRNKAKNIIGCCRTLLEKYNGQVPSDIEELVSLQGVGRKTANVIRGNIYDIPSIVVDTHVKRISKKLGFTKYDDPVKIEFELMEKLPKEHWIRYNTQVIAHGRAICTARSPKCERCFLLPYCKTGLMNRMEDIK
jgi:endonuclease-3